MWLTLPAFKRISPVTSHVICHVHRCVWQILLTGFNKIQYDHTLMTLGVAENRGCPIGDSRWLCGIIHSHVQESNCVIQMWDCTLGQCWWISDTQNLAPPPTFGDQCVCAPQTEPELQPSKNPDSNWARPTFRIHVAGLWSFLPWHIHHLR